MFGFYQFSIALIFRLINAFASTAFFQPDEYFQSWEIAYSEVYNVGFRSWEWQAGVRTSLVPLLFAQIIKISQWLNTDHLVLGRVFMAFVAAMADLYSAAFSELVFPNSFNSAFVLSLFSFFNFYVSTRPFSNTFEMALVAMALYHWVLGTAKMMYKHIIWSLILAQFAIALRPNELLLWPLLALYTLCQLRWGQGIKLTVVGLTVVGVVQSLILWVDYGYYKQYGITVFPIYEFARYNFGSKISEIYGVMPWHWYLSQGIPFLLLGYLPFFLSGIKYTPFKWKLVLALNLLMFSVIPHKEFRFLYFLLPIMHSICSVGLKRIPRWIRQFACFLNIAVGIYFTHFHQRGAAQIVDYVRDHLEIKDITFLMPCHSTPWHAHLQRNEDLNAKFLTCTPPWNIEDKSGYVDEADRFYLDPTNFLKDHPEFLTQYVAIFEPLLPLMKQYNYELTTSFYNGLYNEDSRRRGRVYLLQKKI